MASEVNVARFTSGQAPKKEGGIYADPEVRLALRELFDKKCAYCEGWLTDGWDVEHFRPAKAVNGIEHPGYWWLVYEWTNLYPACIACNQTRIDPANPQLGGQGKGTKFPLLDESTRVTEHTDAVDGEVRGLIDPCVDDPSQHLALDPAGEIVSINGSEMGTTTIDVLGLWRSGYREMRKWALDSMLRAGDEHREYYLSDEAPFCGLLRAYVGQ